jgi:hypothetical protein
MDYLSYLYTPQQMSGGASFGHGTRVGNWSEDFELQQHRVKDYIKKKESGTLTVSKMQAKFMHHLQPAELTKASAGDPVQFGQTLLLWNHAAESFVATVRRSPQPAPPVRTCAAYLLAHSAACPAKCARTKICAAGGCGCGVRAWWGDRCDGRRARTISYGGWRGGADT